MYTAMKKSIWLPLLLFTGSAAPDYNVSPTPDTFVAATPCGDVPRHQLGIPADLECEMIKWRLTFRRDPRRQGRDDFRLQYTYGMTKPGTRGFMNNGTSNEISGTFRITENKGATTGRYIFTLQPTGSKTPIAFLQLNEHLLHLLDQQGHLMIGNAGFSYTFNKQNTHL
ncbi:hypothetical protein Dfer_5360 [Dyadobacter fermentans DSM 18053]|uniref:Uncharacterized protein n=2 Tax=Dyadobacter fermentans TaxID=94254 RepID=C6VU71_DYAFD|nr:hypothetical protein Dfer_5360 [Dyadobacter fermentans DSM 18053]